MTVQVFQCGQRGGKTARLFLEMRRLRCSKYHACMDMMDIIPSEGESKRDYLTKITERIARVVISLYSKNLDPTISYGKGGNVCIGETHRKNGSVGKCFRIPRIVVYNFEKIEHLDHAHLIELAVHECIHLIYDGHAAKFVGAMEDVMDLCVERLKQEEEKRSGML